MTFNIPTTDQLRGAWVKDVWERSGQLRAEGADAGFDEWLAAHDAEIRAEARAEEPEWEWMTLTTLGNDAKVSSGATDEETARAILRWSEDDGESRQLYRRRAPGPWLPVEKNGENT